MELLEYTFLILSHLLYCNAQGTVNITQQKCSAMHSYVELTSDLTEGETILSSQALFAPYTYYVPPYPIVSLSDTENICNSSTITTYLTNRILITSTSELCSDRYKSYVAQQNGAIAMIIGLDETIYPITNDETMTNVTETIPTRGVTQWALADLQRNIDAIKNPQIEFGCNNEPIPLQLCILDTAGDYWWMDGSYVRQIDTPNNTHNGHPMWQRERPYYSADHMYLFLHITATQWYWAITTDDPMHETDDTHLHEHNEIIAKCDPVNGTEYNTLPNTCKVWNMQSQLNIRRGNEQFDPYRNLTVNNGSCVSPGMDSYMCVSSTKSNLAGLRGTYRLFNQNTPFWYREETDCDTTPGAVLFTRRLLTFSVWHSGLWWNAAVCTDDLNTTMTDLVMNPTRCKTWDSIVDNSLSLPRYDRFNDDSFSIVMDKCDGYRACDISAEPAESVCMTRNTQNNMGSMLEGTYTRNGDSGYVKQASVFGYSDGYTMYLEYYSEWNVDQPVWKVSNESGSENITQWIGLTHCTVMNVADCTAPWVIFWNDTIPYMDSTYQITEGDCPTVEPPSPTYGDEYDYFCIDIDDTNAFKESSEVLEANELRGGYVIQRTANMPIYWTKPVNDYIDEEMYLYYDPIYGHWQVSTSLTTMTVGVVCMDSVLYPDECTQWYEAYNGRRLNGTLSFRTEECTFNDVFQKSCSAMHSWLQLSGAMDQTVSSSHTLFAPYKYRIKPAEIVTLVDGDNPCVIGGITTDVSDKIVLLYSKTSTFSPIKCTDQFQAYVMELNNATAVIMASTDNTLSVIKDDDTMGIETSIPMRGITLDTAENIKKAIDIGEIVYGEFNCDDTYTYPLEICASNVGLDIYGNFELQTKRRDINGHPFWKRSGYSLYMGYSDVWLYLHNGNGDTHWYWAVTTDMTLEDSALIAYCNSEQTIGNKSLIIEPTQCNEWKVFDPNVETDGTETSADWPVSDMQMSEGLCNVSDSYFCIKSEQSLLAGLSGTYRLYYESEPVWFREWDNCDNSPGVFYYDSQYFYLMDPMDGWVIAKCWVGSFDFDTDNNDGEYKDEYEKYLLFSPHLCQDWSSVIDGSLDDTLSYDNTLQITDAMDCMRNCTEIGYMPNKLCLHKNSVMHSFLEGEYVWTSVRGPNHNTKEYQRSGALEKDGDILNIYLWYFGELSDRHEWWVLSSHNMSIGDLQNYSLVYGYGACSVNNPINCNSDWNFFWAGMEGIKGAWHSDPEFSVSLGDCAEENETTVEYGEIYDYLCVDITEDYSYENETVIGMLRGGYQKVAQSSWAEWVTGEDTPIWYKPSNDFTNSRMYIYFDKFYGYWQIGTNLTIDNSLLICHNDDAVYPERCNEWYDLYSNSFDDTMQLRVEGCTASDMLSKTSEKDIDAVTVVVAVCVAVIGMIILVTIMYCVYDKKREQRYENFEDEHGFGDNNSWNTNTNTNKGTEMSKKEKKRRKKEKKRKGHTQLAIGTDEDYDSQNESGALKKSVTQGTYDMSPMNKGKTKGSKTKGSKTRNDGEDDSYDNEESDSLSDLENDNNAGHGTDGDTNTHGIDDADDGVSFL